LMQMKKLRQKKLLEGSARIHTRYGHTFTSRSLFQKSIVTDEPENIQAVLATRFQDFTLGRRLLVFGPLLGRGIFTADGAHWTVSSPLTSSGFLDSIDTEASIPVRSCDQSS
jgi:hypothetical protein